MFFEKYKFYLQLNIVFCVQFIYSCGVFMFASALNDPKSAAA